MEAQLVKREDRYDLYDGSGHKIASTLDGAGNKLSLTNCQAIECGYDLDELAKIHHKLAYIQAYNPDIAPYVEADYKTGFQKALELMGDKKFSEQDMYKMFIYGRSIDTAKKHVKELEDKPIDEFFNDFIQSLKQTEWDVTFNPDELDAEGCLILKRK